jgi:hypothetical protein
MTPDEEEMIGTIADQLHARVVVGAPLGPKETASLVKVLRALLVSSQVDRLVASMERQAATPAAQVIRFPVAGPVANDMGARA